jgi:hypothetical protein
VLEPLAPAAHAISILIAYCVDAAQVKAVDQAVGNEPKLDHSFVETVSVAFQIVTFNDAMFDGDVKL